MSGGQIVVIAGPYAVVDAQSVSVLNCFARKIGPITGFFIGVAEHGEFRYVVGAL